MIVLGLHGGVTIGQHEPSATLAVDGEIVAICEEERYLRIKSSYGYLPFYSVKACLKQASVQASEIDLVVISGKTYDDFEPRIREYLKSFFGISPRIELVHHQEAHLATAFYSSDLNEALCLSLDASGDGSSGFVAKASRENGIEVLEEIPTSNSIGFFYSLVTTYLGFTDGDEYKVMGLAPYGEPKYDLDPICKKQDGVWDFDWSYIRSEPALKSPFEAKFNSKIEELLGQAARTRGAELTKFHEDVARSAQQQFEKCLFGLVEHYHQRHPELKALCYAGGVAMNCVANGKLFYSGMFEQIHVPAVSSDRGLSVGCAYLGSKLLGDSPKPLVTPYLGTGYSNDEIENELKANGLEYSQVDDPSKAAAELMAEGKIVGWFQGRSEAGARALGNRSILASAATEEMRDKVNMRIKYREKFRPFAPAVQFARATEYFETQGVSSPSMCFTFKAVAERSDEIRAVVHVDGTARIQTVKREENQRYYDLIGYFAELTGTPVILNTSFNLKGQPIVESPRDAIMTFFGCGLDALVIGDFLVKKPNPVP